MTIALTTFLLSDGQRNELSCCEARDKVFSLTTVLVSLPKAGYKGMQSIVRQVEVILMNDVCQEKGEKESGGVT